MEQMERMENKANEELKEVKVNTICCEKPMINLGEIQSLSNMNTTSCKRYFCGECGGILDIHEYSLDEEELISEIENYDELKDTNIGKELKVNQEKTKGSYEEQIKKFEDEKDLILKEEKPIPQ